MPEQPIIFANKNIQKTMVNLVTGNKPAGWGRKSRSSYYAKDYALELKVAVDQQIETKNDIFYPAKTFCEGPSGVSLRTLYIKINQSARYLCERLDPTNKYKEWWDGMHISTSDEGLRISLKHRSPAIMPVMVISQEQQSKWHRDFDRWLESDETNDFVRENLVLSKDEIKKFNDELEQLSSVIGVVKSHEIKVVKVSIK